MPPQTEGECSPPKSRTYETESFFLVKSRTVGDSASSSTSVDSIPVSVVVVVLAAGLKTSSISLKTDAVRPFALLLTTASRRLFTLLLCSGVKLLMQLLLLSAVPLSDIIGLNN
jgi:hypothetical protein